MVYSKMILKHVFKMSGRLCELQEDMVKFVHKHLQSPRVCLEQSDILEGVAPSLSQLSCTEQVLDCHTARPAQPKTAAGPTAYGKPLSPCLSAHTVH